LGLFGSTFSDDRGLEILQFVNLSITAEVAVNRSPVVGQFGQVGVLRRDRVIEPTDIGSQRPNGP
jgi:hypothetical protein